MAKILEIVFRTVVSIGPKRGHNTKCENSHMKTELLIKMWHIGMTANFPVENFLMSLQGKFLHMDYSHQVFVKGRSCYVSIPFSLCN